MQFRILTLGDLIGRSGRNVVREKLPALIAEHSVDMVIANGENVSGGFGLTETNAKAILAAGIDVITSGNHIWNRPETADFIGRYPNILRPANYPDTLPGKGRFIFRHSEKGVKVGVLNLLGRVFMPPMESPFFKADAEISALREEGADLIVVDFHAEATAEKEALGLYLSDKVELVVGTPTHVQTSDEKIIAGRTGYITDLGRCGSFFSVLGFEAQQSIRGFLTDTQQRCEPGKEDLVLEGLRADFDVEERRCISLKRVRI